jgi:F-box and WD-40 domain protein CDC4
MQALADSQDGEQPPAPPPPTLMEMPAMIRTFDAMPTEIQTYIMYQFLRRCTKPTLKFVAEVVEPLLKVDFLTRLPPELALNVIRHLNYRDLCRAAQTSKRWRQMIDSNERAWKELLDRDGYTLSPHELQRAIKEGWGWYIPHGKGEYEKDISILACPTDDAIQTVPQACPNGAAADSGSVTAAVAASASAVAAVAAAAAAAAAAATTRGRPKRKAASRLANRKKPKKKTCAAEAAARGNVNQLVCYMANAGFPYAAATAAARAVPNPAIGLPSIRTLHLFKSIYRRHHSIRAYWMQADMQPSHIAFRAHQRNVVTCLQLDGDKIMTGSDDTNINVYDARTGALRTRLEGHEGGVWALQHQGNVLVSGSTDRSVRVWDIERGVCTHVFQGHTSTVRCLQILMPSVVGATSDGRPVRMPEEPLILTGSRDSTLRVWRLPQPGDEPYNPNGPLAADADCPYFLRTLSGHQHSVRAIAAHGDTLVSGSYDCTVRVWRVSTGKTIHRLQGHTQKVYSVVLDHWRNRCISGSMDNCVRIWSLETGAVLYNLEGHTSLVGLLELSHDRLVSAAADATLRVWDAAIGECRSTLRGHTGAITCFQHDDEKVVSGSDRTVKMWDVRTGEFVRDLLSDLSCVWQVRFDKRRCVAAVQRNSVTYIEVR